MKSRLIAMAGMCAALTVSPLHAETSQAASKPNAAAASAPSKSGKPGGTVQTETFLVLMPVVTVNDQMGNGCWVRFYDDPNYKGNNLTLVGPVDMPRMTVPGAVWHNWDSAIVGPKARVTVYDNTDFHQKDATLSAGQHVPDLKKRELGWFEEVKSARVSCG